jgi:mono/diheme cytochrome c family protein
MALAVVLLSGAITLVSCSSTSNSSRSKLTPAEMHGQRLFQSTCARCHRTDTTQAMNGPGLQGIMKKQYLPSGAPANDERLRQLIVNGRGNMPALGQLFDDQQINDIIAYVHRL